MSFKTFKKNIVNIPMTFLHFLRIKYDCDIILLYLKAYHKNDFIKALSNYVTNFKKISFVMK